LHLYQGFENCKRFEQRKLLFINNPLKLYVFIKTLEIAASFTIYKGVITWWGCAPYSIPYKSLCVFKSNGKDGVNGKRGRDRFQPLTFSSSPWFSAFTCRC